MQQLCSWVEQSAKFTGTQVYSFIQREILANTLPGRLSKQAPRMLIGMLLMQEELIMNEASLVYHRIYAWWIIVQSWETFRFDDHRGIRPKDVCFCWRIDVGAIDTIKDILGSDRSVRSRLIYINACCFLERKEWLVEMVASSWFGRTVRSRLFTPGSVHQL